MVASAPLLWVGLGLVAAVVALLIALLTSSLTLAVVGWLLGGPVAIGLLAVFIHQDTTRRSHPLYAVSSAADWARRALVVVSLMAVGVNAWTIADVISRGGLG